MIPFVLQTTAQKNARIAKFLTLQKQAKTVCRQTTEKITYVFGGKMTNTSTKQNKNLWDFRSNVFLSTDKSNHNGGLKGEILTSRTVECNVTSALQR